MKKLFGIIKAKLFTQVEKEHSEAYQRRIAFLNKYSLLWHALISCGIVFLVELISRRNFLSACSFVMSADISVIILIILQTSFLV